MDLLLQAIELLIIGNLLLDLLHIGALAPIWEQGLSGELVEVTIPDLLDDLPGFLQLLF